MTDCRLYPVSKVGSIEFEPSLNELLKPVFQFKHVSSL